jgi:dsDNA-specific endonuclease/ATPase MutS2
LRIQINYFSRCLESAIANNLSKVTFIHGVGTGVLKTTIKEVLKEYTNVSYRDGSMKQFGYGAMDVLIK